MPKRAPYLRRGMKIGSPCRLQKLSRLRRLPLLACTRNTRSSPRLWRSKTADLAPGNGELFASCHGLDTLVHFTPPREIVLDLVQCWYLAVKGVLDCLITHNEGPEAQQYRGQVRHRDMCKYQHDRRPAAPQSRTKQCGWRSIALSSVPGFHIRPTSVLDSPYDRIGAAADQTMKQSVIQSHRLTIMTKRQ